MKHLPGYVDVWSNETGTTPVHSFRGPGSVRQVALSNHAHAQNLFAVHDNIVRLEHMTEDAQWKQQRMLEMPSKVWVAVVINILITIMLSKLPKIQIGNSS